jgi:hypothetical protein
MVEPRASTLTPQTSEQRLSLLSLPSHHRQNSLNSHSSVSTSPPPVIVTPHSCHSYDLIHSPSSAPPAAAITAHPVIPSPIVASHVNPHTIPTTTVDPIVYFPVTIDGLSIPPHTLSEAEEQRRLYERRRAQCFFVTCSILLVFLLLYFLTVFL